jgi:hypothetical protein
MERYPQILYREEIFIAKEAYTIYPSYLPTSPELIRFGAESSPSPSRALFIPDIGVPLLPAALAAANSRAFFA